jgi:hypothetical protein
MLSNKEQERKKIIQKNNIDDMLDIIENEKEHFEKEINYIKLMNCLKNVKLQIDTFLEINKELAITIEKLSYCV